MSSSGPRVNVRLAGKGAIRIKCEEGDEIADLRSVLPKEINTFSDLFLITDSDQWNSFKDNADRQTTFLNSIPKPAALDERHPIVNGMCVLAVPPQESVGGGAGVAAPFTLEDLREVFTSSLKPLADNMKALSDDMKALSDDIKDLPNKLRVARTSHSSTISAGSSNERVVTGVSGEAATNPS